MVKFVNIVNIALLRRFWSNVKSWVINNMVAKEEGKGLSSNDFTDDERNNLNQALEKLNTIEEGAQKNVSPDWENITNRPFYANWTDYTSSIAATTDWITLSSEFAFGKRLILNIALYAGGIDEIYDLGVSDIESEILSLGYGVNIEVYRNAKTLKVRCESYNNLIKSFRMVSAVKELDPIFLPETLESTIANLTARIEALESANA